MYSTHNGVTLKLRSARRGNFGIVDKVGIPQKKINFRMKRHEQTELHQWCQQFKLDSEKLKIQAAEENYKACTQQVTNAIYTIKNLGSSYDFIKENDKDMINYSISNQSGIKPPTQNDGRQEFFDTREKAFCELSDSVKKSFQTIKSFAVTLDKVTAGHVPYTVIMTYYFHGGKIHVLLNRVHPMTSNEYDGEGTAHMVIETLQDTLHLTKQAIAAKCHHFVTDGVYTTDEERLTGGGLKLVNHFASLLGLQPGDVTGSWDISHLMQLAYGDLINRKGQPFFKNLINNIFDLMSDFNAGKASLVFKESAEELQYCVLTNKSNQRTRFVRALLRGIQSLLRNIPCLYNIWGNAVKECLLENDNTGAKEALKMQERLSDGKFIASVIGIVQILEEYARTSLDSQNLSFFPTSVLQSSDVHLSNIKKLADKWTWSPINPKLANIGCPSEIIQKLLKGEYTPYVSAKSITRAQVLTNISLKNKNQINQNLADIEDHSLEVQDTLSWKVSIPENEYGAGSVPVMEFSQEDLTSIEKKLSDVASYLYSRYNLRFDKVKSPLLKAAKNAFKNQHDVTDSDAEQLKLLDEVIESIPGPHKEEFDSTECLAGYKLFV